MITRTRLLIEGLRKRKSNQGPEPIAASRIGKAASKIFERGFKATPIEQFPAYRGPARARYLPGTLISLFPKGHGVSRKSLVRDALLGRHLSKHLHYLHHMAREYGGTPSEKAHAQGVFHAEFEDPQKSRAYMMHLHKTFGEPVVDSIRYDKDHLGGDRYKHYVWSTHDDLHRAIGSVTEMVRIPLIGLLT